MRLNTGTQCMIIFLSTQSTVVYSGENYKPVCELGKNFTGDLV